MTTPALLAGLMEDARGVGSQVTCNPSPPLSESDLDIIVLVKSGRYTDAVNALLADGFEGGGSIIADEHNRVPVNDRFESFKKSPVNIILTESETFYQRFLAGTSVAKRLNLLDKADRVALFQAVLYGETCDGTGYDPFNSAL